MRQKRKGAAPKGGPRHEREREADAAVDFPIDGVLDLHTFRPAEVHDLVHDYLDECGKRGITAVRIIHGKGLGSLDRKPVLKNKVRNWLVQKDEVLAFCQARAADGGSGALMVLLKGS